MPQGCLRHSLPDAMRYVDSEGRIAWKATPWLRDYLMDLQRDVEAEFEQEDV